jgi:hypothetical protein
MDDGGGGLEAHKDQLISLIVNRNAICKQEYNILTRSRLRMERVKPYNIVLFGLGKSSQKLTDSSNSSYQKSSLLESSTGSCAAFKLPCLLIRSHSTPSL